MAATDYSVHPEQAGTATIECDRTRSSSLKIFSLVAPSRKSSTPLTVLQESTSDELNKPVTRQHAERDSRCFWMVLILVSLTLTARPLVCWLTQVPLIPLIVILRMLLHLLRLVDETTLVVGVLLWLVFGGHQRLMAPYWLQPPMQSAQAQLEEQRSDKQFALVAKTQQHHAVDTASLVTLGCSPIAMLSIPPCYYAEETTMRDHHSIVDVVVVDTAPAYHAVAATFKLADDKFTFLERSDTVERNRATAFDTCYSFINVDATLGHPSKTPTPEYTVASSASPGQIAATEHMNGSIHDPTRPVANVCVKDLAVASQKCTPAVQIQGSTACEATSDDTSGSENDLIPTTSGSTGSSSTLLSSEDSRFAISGRLTNDEDHAMIVGLVEGEITPELCPKKHTIVDHAEVARLMAIHKNPTFCEGLLDNVRREALYRRYRDVRDFYNQDESASDFTGVASWPDRFVSGDEEDIYCMLEEVWHHLTSRMQQYVINNGLRELIRTRDGITGLNFFSAQLELAWHKTNPLKMSGEFHQVTDIKDVYIYQMLKTRNHRTPCLTGSGAHSDLGSDHRQYLTDEQKVQVNQGCVEHVEDVANAEVSEKVQGLRSSPENGETELDNPVLGWLDDMDGVEYFDADDFIPCECGKKARHDHLRFRYTDEPGYNPSQYAYATSKPGFLQEEALEPDRLRKTLEATYYGPAVGFPRCQYMAQICDLHTIPSNNLWILVDDCVEDANECLLSATGDLPVPGFVGLQKYPRGFRIPRGFLGVKRDDLPPRCKHGYLHPPFADHCNRCFPNGEHNECVECDAHNVVRAIKRNPWMEAQYEAACKQHDQEQLALASKADADEKARVLQAQHSARVSYCFGKWRPAVVV